MSESYTIKIIRSTECITCKSRNITCSFHSLDHPVWKQGRFWRDVCMWRDLTRLVLSDVLLPYREWTVRNNSTSFSHFGRLFVCNTTSFDRAVHIPTEEMQFSLSLQMCSSRANDWICKYTARTIYSPSASLTERRRHTSYMQKKYKYMRIIRTLHHIRHPQQRKYAKLMKRACCRAS